MLVIDVQGARQVRSRGIETIGIFVLPPSAAVLEQRLRGRSKDSEEQIRRRLQVASDEVAEYRWIPLAELFAESTRVQVAEVRNVRRRVEALQVGDFTIWGMTERILSTFERLIR